MKKQLEKAYLVVQQLCKGTLQSTHAAGVQPSVVIPTKVENAVPGGRRLKSAKKVNSAVPGDPTKKVESVVPGGQSGEKVESAVVGDPTKVESSVPRGQSAKKLESVKPGDPSMMSGTNDASGTLKDRAGGVTKSLKGSCSPYADNTPLAHLAKSVKKKKALETKDAPSSDQKEAPSNKVKTRSRLPK